MRSSLAIVWRLVGASGVLFKASIMVVIVGILPLMCAYAAAAAHAVVLPRVALPVGLSFRVYTIYAYIRMYIHTCIHVYTV